MNYDAMIKALNAFLDLGVPIVTPLMLFALSLVFRVPLGRAVRSAVTYGVGFIGIFTVLNLLLGALSSVATKLIENTGLQLEVLDVGWPVLAAVAFGVPTFVTVFFGVLLTNLVMFAFKLTKTLDIDFHNYYHWVLPATVVYFATNNLAVATIVGIANAVITFKLADWTEKYVAEWWELPGISIPHMSTVGWFPFCYAVDWVIDRIPGIRKIRVDTGRLQERIGVLGEPMLIGLVIGLALGAVARLPIKDLLNTAMQLAAAMVLMPRMIALLMEGLVPIYQSARDWIMTRFPGYDFRIGLDAAVLVGKSEVLVTGMLMVPVTIALAVILPGNRVLPFADLALLPFFAIWTVGVNRGNIFRGIIIATGICVVLLYGAGFVAPTMTAMGQAAGFEAQTSGLYVSLEGGSITGSQFLNLAIFSMLNMNPWLIALVAVVSVPVLLPIFKWVTTRPRKASDLSPEERAALVATGWELTPTV
jgi:PTS system galactitol-specific IIC component